jgi:sugar O-acyltransferase (sialic acid O-acetyltransferase NeuD family)
MKRLLIIGIGGHGRSVAEAVLLATQAQRHGQGQCFELTAFLDDTAQPQQHVWDWPVWGTTAMLHECRGRTDAVVVAVGNNSLRAALHQRVHAAGLTLATVIHPTATVSPRAAIGAGSVVMAGAVVGTEAHLGEGVIVNCGAVVDHDCVVEAFAHLGGNASMAGGAILGRGAWMQTGTSLGYGAGLPAEAVLRVGETMFINQKTSHSVQVVARGATE